MKIIEGSNIVWTDKQELKKGLIYTLKSVKENKNIAEWKKKGNYKRKPNGTRRTENALYEKKLW